jgi:hypothetical protein
VNGCLRLNIGTLHFDLHCANQRLLEQLGMRYALFQRVGGVGLPIHIQWDPASTTEAFSQPTMEFVPGKIVLSAEGYRGEISVTGEAWLNILDADPQYGIDYYLRVAAAQQAYLAGGLLFHGAGIIHREKGYIFYGHSGSGKTTVCTLSSNDLVLNDDLLVLMPGDHGWLAYSTPFWNPSQVKPANQNMRIQGFYRLVKDLSVFLKSMSPAQAVSEMIANTPVITGDPANLPVVLERCRQISAAVPQYWLHFLKSATFWKAINDV